MEDIDTHLWVIEPEKPRPKDTRRRLALAKHATLLLIVDPAEPRGVAECHFFGAESAIAPLKQRFNANVRSWDRATLPRENLSRCLGLSLPSKEEREAARASAFENEGDEFGEECAICYERSRYQVFRSHRYFVPYFF